MTTQERNRRPAERLVLLEEAARALLSRLDDASQATQDATQDGPPWTKPKFKKVVQIFEQGFPKHPSLPDMDKSQGADDLQANSKQYCGQLEEQYLALHDAEELRQEIWKLLTEIADDYACPTFDDFPNIASLYLDIFVRYVQICLMLTQIPGREMLACFYAYCFQYATGHAAQSFAKIAQFLHDRCKTRDAALSALRKEMSEKPSKDTLRRTSLDRFLARLVLGPTHAAPSGPADSQGEGGVLTAFQKLSAPSLLLEEDLLGLVSKLDSIEYPAGLGCIRDEWCYYQLPMLARMGTWLGFLYIACPHLCYAHQRGMDGLKAAMRTEWVSERCGVPTWTHIELYRVFHEKAFIAEFDKEYKDKGGFKQGKADYREATEWFRKHAGQERRARREYLKERIEKMVSLLSDCPGLVAPQFHMVQAVLGMARDEVMWYWRHKAAPPRDDKKHAKLSVDLGDAHDVDTVALIAAMLSLRRIACKVASGAASYYQTYLRDVMAPLLAEATQAAGGQLGRAKSAHAALSAVMEACRQGDVAAMAGLRLDVDRLLLQVLRSHKEMCGDGAEAAVSRPVRQLAKLLQKTAFLSTAAEAPSEALVTASSLHELWWKSADFPAAFKDALSSSPAAALGMVQVYDDFVRAGNRSLPHQLKSIGAAAVKEAHARMVEVAQTAVEMVHEIQIQFLKPSHGGTRPEMAGLLSSMAELCAFAIKDGAAMRVYNVELRGGEFLLGALKQDLRRCIRSVLWEGGGRSLRSLAVAEKEVGAYLTALRTLESYGGIPLQDLVEPVHRNLFLEQQSAKVGDRPVLDAKDNEDGQESRAIGDYYVRLLAKTALDDDTIAGLRPLARLLGPGGIKVVDNKLLQRCKDLAVNAAHFIQNNEPGLRGLMAKDAGRYHAGTLKSLSVMGASELASALSEMGSILDLRRRMHRALLEALDTSLLPEATQLAVALTGSTVRSDLTAAVDLIAHDCGGADALWPADPALQSVLVADNGPLSESGDQTWELAVYALATLPHASHFSTADSSTRASSAPYALIALVVLSVSARMQRASKGPAEIEAAVQESVRSLVACTGAVALPMLVGAGDKRARNPPSAPKLVAFLVSLVQAAEDWSPTVRKRALPDALSRCLHLAQLLSDAVGPAAHAYDDDED